MMNQPTPPALELIKQLFPNITWEDLQPAPPRKRRPATIDDIAEMFGLRRLSELTTAHMTPQQSAQYLALIDKIKQWRQETKQHPGLSMLISSKQVGTGKTHIAKAVHASFCTVVGEMEFLDDEPQFALEYGAKIFTARELINILGGDEQLPLPAIAPKHVKTLVVDDLGREGYLDYVKADQQAIEKQSRYFHLINHIYERRNGRHPVSLFITTNLQDNEIQQLLGDATYSRLLELCPRGYIVQLQGIGDYRRVKSGR